MGNYLNPGNEAFKHDSQDELYVDKTGLIEYTNRVLHTSGKCLAVSHARRFGKSQAARMIEAFYSKGCDSRQIFESFKIAENKGWDQHLNRYNVIHLDMATLVNSFKFDLLMIIKRRLYDEMIMENPELKDTTDFSYSLPEMLNQVYKMTNSPFVVIIDEWDCVVRNYANHPDFVHEYMQFLHDLFKSEEAQSFLALGYITGILPIMKINDESALNNFSEYTMIDSDELTEFFGFNEKEVKALCDRYDMDFSSVKEWYDGYEISGKHMYNPNSVYFAMQRHNLRSYWKNTASFKAINQYITLNFDGLKDDVLTMLAGGRVAVDVNSFQNDLSIIEDKDDALTALIHLGYLGYDCETEEAFIPNYEVSMAYQAALKTSDWTEVAKSIENARRALNAMLACRSDEFAGYIDLAHEAYTSIKNYNDENALYSVLYMTLFTARAYYNVARELPAGKGFADMVLIPRKDAGNRPAVVLELKYDKSADAAIKQIKEKRYAGKLSGYADRILLVGINYDKETKQHDCVIENWENAEGILVNG